MFVLPVLWFAAFLSQRGLEAVVIEEHACSEIFSGTGGVISTPYYPSEYPDHLGCTWTIQTSSDSRVELNIEDFQLEKGAECFDKLIIKDGIQKDAPTLDIFCGSNGRGKTVTSSGNQMQLLFISDGTLGDRGIKIVWRAIDQVPIVKPKDDIFPKPWKALEGPEGILYFTSGLAPETIWILDKNNDVYYYSNKKWEVISGKFSSITVDQAGIFAIHPTNFSIYGREGVSVERPDGEKWKFLAANRKGIRQIEATNGNLIFGIDKYNMLHYANIEDLDNLDHSWKEIFFRADKPPSTFRFSHISCGVYSCWVTLNDGSVYASGDPLVFTDPGNVDWEKVSAEENDEFKYVTAGFGNNVWGIKQSGHVYKKPKISSLLPIEGDWVEQESLQLKDIHAGLGGVYGLREDGSFGFYEGAVCGGIVIDSEGEISSPNSPENYPKNLNCLWIIKPPNAVSIDISFTELSRLGQQQNDCNDYLATAYPGVKEPIIECGNILDKRIIADHVWIELVTDDVDDGEGYFKFHYYSNVASPTLLPITPTVTPPDGWELMFQLNIQDQQIKSIFVRNGMVWFLTTTGNLYTQIDGQVDEVGKDIASLAVDDDHVYVVDGENNLLLREGVTTDIPKGTRWGITDINGVQATKVMITNNVLLIISEDQKLYTTALDNFQLKLSKTNGQKVKAIAQNFKGGWFLDPNSPGKLFYISYRGIPGITSHLSFKDVIVTSNGDIWGQLTDNRIAKWKGEDREGARDHWDIFPIYAVRIYAGVDGVYFEDNDSNLFKKVDDETTIFEELKIATVQNAYRIDSFPKEDKIEVWVIGGVDGRTPFSGLYDPNDRSIQFSKHDQTVELSRIQLVDISIGESGVWGLTESGYAAFYNQITNQWKIDSINLKFEMIESASPKDTVYAIESDTNLLCIRRGTGWFKTSIKASIITSSPLKTYIKLLGSDWRAFSEPLHEGMNIKTWISSWEILNLNNVDSNLFSAGFGPNLLYFYTSDAIHQVFTTPFVWLIPQVTDFSAGPTIFAISNSNIHAKEVTPCFGFYRNAENLKINALLSFDSLCMWYILSDKNKVYEIEEETDVKTCGFDVYTGENMELEPTCLPFEKGVYMTAGRLYINLLTRGEENRQLGLKFNLKHSTKPECGGAINGTDGELTSPNFPGKYTNKEKCIWSITVNPKKIIIVTIEVLETEENLDFLVLIDGLNEDDTMLGRYSGKLKNTRLSSSKNVMRIEFRTDESQNYMGFKLRWAAVDKSTETKENPDIYINCGGYLNTNTGLMASPNWPLNYDNNINCDWFITVDSGKQISLRILKMDIEDSASCEYDSLMVYDGHHGNAELLGAYCGEQKNGEIVTTGNRVRLRMMTDSSTTSTGFKIQWQMRKDDIPDGWKEVVPGAVFKFIITSVHGHIWSYNNITKEMKSVITQNVISDENFKNIRDIVMDWNGYWILTNDNEIIYMPEYGMNVRTPVTFDSVTDGNTQDRLRSGILHIFVLKSNNEIYWKRIDGKSEPWQLFKVNVKEMSEDANGVWIIRKNGRIEFFRHNEYKSPIKIPLPSPLSKATKIFTGYGNNVYAIIDGKLYRREGVTLEYPQGNAWIELPVTGVDQVFFNKNGVYILLLDGRLIKHNDIPCGGIFATPHNTITYPEFDSMYQPNQHCIWYIQVDDIKSIVVKQLRFQLENSKDCIRDRVIIAAVSDTKTSPVKLCGDGLTTDKYLEFPSNRIVIEFISDNQNEKRGFEFSYTPGPITKATDKPTQTAKTTIPTTTTTTTTTTPVTTTTTTAKPEECGESFTNDMGVIKSPNYPSRYGANLNCEYIIIVSPDTRVRLEFLNFDVEHHSSCVYDSLKIFELRDGDRKLTKTLCGTEEIPDYISEGSALILLFNTDGAWFGDGFRIKYTEISPPTKPTTVAQPPTAPFGWTVISPPNKRFSQLFASVETSVVWALDVSGYPFYWDKENWINPISGKPYEGLSVAPGNYGVYGINANGDLFFRQGVTESNPGGTYWSRVISNNDKYLVQIGYGANNEIFAITEEQEVIIRSGTTRRNPEGVQWKTVAIGYVSASVGTYGYWLIDPNSKVYFATYVSSKDLVGHLNVVPINGKFKKVVSGFGGNVWGLSVDNEVFRRVNVNSLKPSGTAWEKVPGLKLLDIAAGYDAVYGVNEQGEILTSKDHYCGGIFRSTEGLFQSPDHPTSYPSNSNCLYIIDTPLYEQLTIDFPLFDVEKTKGCYKDYFLAAVDGKFPSKYAVKKYCGNALSRKVFRNRALFEFSSDGSNEKLGFVVTWRADTSPFVTTPVPEILITTTKKTDSKYFKECGGSLSGASGVILHPNYPRPYKNNQDCRYEFTVAPNHRIQLSFSELDLDSSVTGCNNDFIEVRDMVSDNIKRFCKDGPRNTFLSMGRNLIMRFYSDNEGRRRGFNIKWKAVERSTISKCLEESVAMNLLGSFQPKCDTDGLYKKQQCDGSTGYCWCVDPHSGDKLEGTATRPGQERVDCLDDTIKTTAKPTQATPTRSTILGIDCRHKVSTYSGYIYHKTYPKAYQNNVHCIWTIEADSNQVVTLEFKLFKLEQSLDCVNDYIVVHDGPDENSPSLGKFCGREILNKFVSSSNAISVVFKTNEDIFDSGFVALYKHLEKDSVEGTESPQACRYSLSGSSGEIISPNYPKKYNENLHCYWHITVDEGSRIQLRFVEMDVESNGRCSYDYVRIIDGLNTNSEVLGQYCGSHKPSPVFSSGNTIQVYFRSDDRQTRRGFKLTWDRYSDTTTTTQLPHVTQSPTTPHSVTHFTLTGDSGEITSPNYPDNYAASKDFYWKIYANPNEKIMITFVDLQIESGSNCRFDYIQIYDGSDDSDSVIGRYCGVQSPEVLKSTGHQVFVHFHSNDVVNRKGFKLTWKAFSETPMPPYTSPGTVYEYTLSGSGGEIVSPNYPNRYDLNRDYYWKITTAQGQKIELTFIFVDIESGPNCRYDYLQVRDGNNRNAPNLGKYCGRNEPDPITSSSNQMYLHFHSDEQQDSKGFKLKWRAKQPPTDSPKNVFQYTLSGEHGEIVSPSYPNNYPVSKDYYWKINGEQFKKLKLTIIEMDIESAFECRYDFIQIKDSNGADLGKFCGRNPPSPITSIGNMMFIHFHSDDQVTGKGFKWRWETVYDGTGPNTVAPPRSVYRYTLSGTGSEVVSPDYPNNYAVSQDYYWTINGIEGSKIQLSLTDLDINRETNGKCPYDFIKIMDGGDINSPLLGQFCGNKMPATITSSGNRMFVFFHSDEQTTGRGFKFVWKTLYGNVVTTPATPTVNEIVLKGSSGEIISPNYPERYDNKKDYYWKIEGPIGRKIELTFVEMNVEIGSNCKYDYIAVLDGADTNSNELGKYCGQVLPDPVRSTSNHMTIHFHSDNQQTRKGFVLKWKAFYKITPGPTDKTQTVYTTTLSGISGEIISPNYPNNYDMNLDYYWKINAAKNRKIQLTFIDMRIDATAQCSSDYLLVRDGADESAAEIGRFCGSLILSPIKSSDNQLYLHFHSDGSKTMPGFQLKWEAIPGDEIHDCAYSLSGSGGKVQTPNYPDNYEPNKDCFWLITADANQKIVLSFEDLEIEQVQQCQYDYVMVRDGNDVQAQSLGKFCGNTPPNDIRSSGNQLYIHFHTDGQGNRKGFSLRWKAEDYIITSIPATTSKSEFTISGSSGDVNSPNYPNDYAHNQDYFWSIEVGSNDKIELTFLEMDIDGGRGCGQDYISIRNGASVTAQELGRYCGRSIPDPVQSLGNRMYIHFHTDGRGAGRGFRMQWKTIYGKTEPEPEECSYSLTSESGEVTSPDYPLTYPLSKDCYWKIVVSNNRRIRYRFVAMDLEPNNKCLYDFVQLRDGGSINTEEIGKYCGDVIPAVGETTGNELFVHFRSDTMVTKSGFKMVYEAFRDVVTTRPTTTQQTEFELTGSSGEVTSPNYPKNYELNKDYYWTIRADQGYVIELTFMVLDIEGNGRRCNSDYISLKDGSSITAREIGRYCGREPPSSMVKSTGDRMFIHFHSDGQLTSKGFRFAWRTMPAVEECIYELDGHHGEIMSSNYPNNYDVNKDCYWKIIVDHHEKIEIRVEDMDIQSSTSCRSDHLSIYDGDDENDPLIAKFCGEKFRDVVVSSGHSLYLHFHSDARETNKGFILKWKAFHDDVTQPPTTTQKAVFVNTLTEASGSLNSPNYPLKYNVNEDHYWTITVAQDSLVSLVFDFMDLEPSEDCSNDYIMVRDGGDRFAKVVGRYCGRFAPTAALKSTGNEMFVHFHSDRKRTRRGFLLKWKTEKFAVESCDFKLTEKDTSIDYPGDGRSYEVNKDCYWHIRVRPGKMISMRFMAMELEKSTNCKYDYLIIRDGGDVNSNMIGKYCGEDIPDEVSSTGSEMLLHFHSDNQQTGKGFFIKYQETEIMTTRIPTTTMQTEFLVTGSSGKFSSPNFPNNYEVNKDYYWTITASGGQVVELTFLDMYIGGDGRQCESDYISIRDGASTTSREIGRYCAGEYPIEALVSTGSRMFIHFHTDREQSFADRGFLVSWKSMSAATTLAPCRFTLTEEEGEFVSRGYPVSYHSNEDCYWKITVDEGMNIQVTFTDVDIEYKSGCRSDFISVKDGPDIDSYALRRKICGDEIPETMISTGNHLLVHFHSDEGTNNKGFKARWKAFKETTRAPLTTESQTCEYSLSGDRGVVSSPGYPANYPLSKDCYWTINGGRNKKIKLTFVDIDVEYGANCKFDYVNIKNGAVDLGTNYCGRTIPEPFVTDNNLVYVHFHSDDVTSTKGFKIEWEAFSEVTTPKPIATTIPAKVCDYTLRDEEGEITSPNYPDYYDFNMTCVWRIVATSNKIIEVMISDIEIEDDNNCKYDYVMFRDGDSETSDELGKYCGRTAPNSIKSTGNRMYVTFQSDSQIVRRGFKLRWRSMFPVVTRPTTTPSNVINYEITGKGYGVIMSPNYPSKYEVSKDYFWKLTVAPRMKIVFMFDAIDVESGTSCQFDYIEIRDGLGSNDPVLGKYCTSQLPEPVTTTDNVARIQFHSDYLNTRTGFKLQWQAVKDVPVTTTTTPKPECRFTLSGMEGTFTSPNFPSPYNLNEDCYWHIVAPRGNQVEIKVVHMDVEGGTGCRYDYIVVRDGRDESGELIGRYCGAFPPVPVRSSGSNIFVHFHSDDKIKRKGFKFTWKATDEPITTQPPTTTTTTPTTTTLMKTTQPKEIFYTVTGERGVIESPNYPNKYENSKDWYWTISAEEGKQVYMNFVNIDIERSTGCKFDYIQIYDGRDNTAPPYGEKICGKVLPGVIISTGSYMYLHFHSDDQNARKGFRVMWGTGVATTTPKPITTTTTPNKDCEFTYTGKSGTFSSPNYPRLYDKNIECHYNIEVEADQKIQLRFLDMAIEAGSNCKFDYLEVMDLGSASRDNPKYCGSDIPQMFTSSGNQLRLHFRSDDQVRKRGFNINWKAIGGAPVAKEVEYILQTAEGEIVSPGYPNNYASLLDYYWTIKTLPGNRIKLIFTDMQIESRSSCRYDYVQVNDGTDKNGDMIGRFCGRDIPDAVTSSGHNIFVHFHSDEKTAGRGFKLNWETVLPAVATTTPVPECRYTYTERSGEFRSPNHPSYYPKERECYYTISVGSDETILVQVMDFDLEMSRNCNYDYLAIYNGRDDNSEMMGKYCGTEIPMTIASSTNHLYFHFRSDVEKPRTGFRFRWIVANPTTTATTTTLRTYEYTLEGNGGDILSPNYPQAYDLDRDYYWTITVDESEVVYLIFDDMQIESGTQCMYDYIIVKDGRDENAETIGKYCGRTRPDAIYSSGNILYIHFHSDEQTAMKGFRMRWEAREPINTSPPSTLAPQTGNVYLLRDPSGTVTSPGYPNKYDKGIDVYWRILAPRNRVIEVTFDDINVEFSKNCLYDYIHFKDGSNDGATSLGKFCGTKIPASIYSTSNKMYVHFHSDDQLSKKGFKFTYKAISRDALTDPPTTKPPRITEDCDYQLTGQSGVIQSPNFPQNYNNNEDCYWHISAQSNKIVQLKFEKFDIEGEGMCSYDYLHIYDGVDSTGELIDKYCGSGIPDPAQTTGKDMYLHFKADDRNSKSGFRLTWKVVDRELSTAKPTSTVKQAPVCEFKQTGRRGTVTHPNYPEPYEPNRNCAWVIEAPAGRVIRVRFTEIDIESSSRCYYDYLEIRDGGNSDASSLGRFCGNSRIDDVLSTGNQIYIVFNSDDRNVNDGFLLSWTAVSPATPDTQAPQTIPPDNPCIEEFRSAESQFHHDSYPYSYKPNLDCRYIITAPRNMRVVLYFSRFDVEESPNCYKDYILITEGVGRSERLVARYCGSETPSTIRSLENVLTVRFISDGSIERGGFLANYIFEMKPSLTTQPPIPTTITTTESNPIGQLNADRVLYSSSHRYYGTEGIIAHPGYPKNYDNFVQSSWIITTLPNTLVSVSFNSFELQPSYDCEKDYLAIYDGTKTSDRLIAKHCRDESGTLMASSNNMLIIFKTDARITKSGFMGTWKAEKRKERQTGHDICDQTVGIENEITSGKQVFLVAPSSNVRERAIQKSCVRQLTALPDQIFKIKFEEFQLPGPNRLGECMDYLSLRDGEDWAANELAKFCGSDKPKIMYTSSNELFIELFYKTNRFVSFYMIISMFERPMTKVQYFQQPKCGDTIRGERGTLTNPDEVLTDDKFISCIWLIETLPSSQIQYSLPQIQLPGNCDASYIILRDGHSSDSSLIDKHCGESVSVGNARTTSNKLWVEYRTLKSFIGQFVLLWKQLAQKGSDCGGIMTEESGYLSSPNYPLNFNHAESCLWRIVTEDNRRVVLNIEVLRIGTDCDTDYVYVRDGMSSESPSLGRFCNRQQSSDLRSTGNTMWVELKTGCTTNKAFRAFYRTESYQSNERRRTLL